MKVFLKQLSGAASGILMLVSFTNALAQTNTITPVLPKNDSIFAKVEIEASFPGGPAAWTRYVTNAIVENQSKLKKSDYGTCIIKFIVNTKGRVSGLSQLPWKTAGLQKLLLRR